MGMDTDRRDERADHERNAGERGKWLSPLIALLGVWMIALAFVLDVTGAQFWSDVLVGALLIGVGGYNYSRQANERLANSAIALIAVAAGLWLIAAPYVLGADAGLTESAYDLWFYNHIAVGLLAAGLGAYSAYMTRDHQQDTRRTKA
ncbi:SPW repeat domain-containing protein [Halorubrum sp. DTA98]|uniref:SPW repeat domain-containing protein n=1 Tax=Halorubrum sp. DTA98 TaxID=3402163 RepID=UPI003AB0CE58